MEKAKIIEFREVSKKYLLNGRVVRALGGINLSIEEGGVVGIIGRSGAGKSTLLRCINGLELADEGEVIFEGIDLKKAKKRELVLIRKKIGMIFQGFNLLSRRTALENVALPLEILGREKGDRLKVAEECLRKVGLGDKRDAYPGQLSGGQKQRVGIARALAAGAEVILSDEGTSALDPETTKEILGLLRSLNETMGITIVLITHEMGVIREICDYVYVMAEGKVVEEGKTEDIFIKPKHELTSSFVNSALNSSIPDVIKEKLVTKGGVEGKRVAVLRLIFSGESAQKPIMAELIQKNGAAINILSGFIDHIGRSTYGTLIIGVEDEGVLLERTQGFLRAEGVFSEILGYM